MSRTKASFCKIILLLTTFSLVAMAQGDKEPKFTTDLQPDKKIFDFGDIKEIKGKVTHTFTLSNQSLQTYVISDVNTWCGCTTADYTKSPVRPGEKARVTVTYDPYNRPGRFSKECVVMLNDGSRYLRLWVKGNVLPYEHPVTEDHPYSFGHGLYMSNRVLPFRSLRVGERYAFSLRMANDTDKPMNVSFKRQPNNRLLQMPDTIQMAPRERRIVEVSYTPRTFRNYKSHIDVLVSVNGKPAQPLLITWLPNRK